MNPTSDSREQIRRFFIKKDKFFNVGTRPFFFFCFLCFTLFPSFYIFYAPDSVKFTSKDVGDGDGDGTFLHAFNQTQAEEAYEQTNSSLQLRKGIAEDVKCDLFKGRWVPDAEGYSYYTNFSCRTIPHLRNCFLHGRMDRDFLHWRWKPDECELPRFHPRNFLAVVQGKTMAFIGDSLARNQMESLLCLLSGEETPVEVNKDGEDQFRAWQFPSHNFTLMVFWSQFLVTATDIVVNGSATGGFHLQLDKVDDKWAKKLPVMDFAIFSDAHWFFRQNYLYEGGKLIGCVYCQVPNVTDLGPGYAIRRAFQLAFKYINDCQHCARTVNFLRTYSPSHFENGAWNMGGYCNRTRPLTEEDNTNNWEFRNIQVEEIERARKQGAISGNTFHVLDITRAMQMRPDGHPGLHWGNKWMKGYNDCIHWCLPGPIDAWNELLFEMLRRQIPNLPQIKMTGLKNKLKKWNRMRSKGDIAGTHLTTSIPS